MWRIYVLTLSLLAVSFVATFILVLYSQGYKVNQIVVEASELSIVGSKLMLKPSKVTSYTHKHQPFVSIASSAYVSKHTELGLFEDLNSLIKKLRQQGDLFAVLIIPSRSVQVSIDINNIVFTGSYISVDFSYLKDDEQVRLNEKMDLNVGHNAKCQKLSRSVLQDENFTAQHGELLIGHSSQTYRFG
jgi:hypothetical protein